MTQDQMRAAFENWAAELAGPFPFDFALDVYGNYKSQMLFYMFMGWQAGRASSIGDGHDYQRQNPTAYIHESVVRKIIGDRNEWRERASLLSHSAGQAVPEGWKLVPMEPDLKMVIAGENYIGRHAWAKMIVAAPAPSKEEGK